MHYVSGKIYDGEGFKEGYLGYEDGVIKERGEGAKKDVLANGIIIPTFANAHMHIGDSVVLEELKGNLEEIVAPPNGLKHRILKSTPNETMLESMKSAAKKMLYSGIEHFCDFREGGFEGVALLKEALSDTYLAPKIFGRPVDLRYNEKEMEELLKVVDGIGLSSISDWDTAEIKKVSEHTKSRKKSFTLHASERVREDIDAILDLSPDFLIHMNEASDNDLEICAQNKVPIAVCPRAEMFFGYMPDIPRMLKKGLSLSLGTDNSMLNKPHSVLREMEFTYKISRSKGDISAMDVLKMAVQNPRKVLNVGYDIPLNWGKEASFIVFQLPAKDPAYALVNGASNRDISLICINGQIIKRP